MTKQQRYVLKKAQKADEFKKFRESQNLSNQKYRANVRHKVKAQGNMIKELKGRINGALAIEKAAIKEMAKAKQGRVDCTEQNDLNISSAAFAFEDLKKEARLELMQEDKEFLFRETGAFPPNATTREKLLN